MPAQVGDETDVDYAPVEANHTSLQAAPSPSKPAQAPAGKYQRDGSDDGPSASSVDHSPNSLYPSPRASSDDMSRRGRATSMAAGQAKDHVGEAMVRVLNDPSRGFLYPLNIDIDANCPSGGSDALSVETDEFVPLLSSQNIAFVVGMARELVKPTIEMVNEVRTGSRKSGGQRSSYSTRSTLQSTAAFLVLGSVVLAGPTTVVVLLSIRTMLLSFAFLASVLIDLREAEMLARKLIPIWLQKFASFLSSLAVEVWSLVDGHLFLGNEYAGRDGTRALGGRNGEQKQAQSEATRSHAASLLFCRNVVDIFEIRSAKKAARKKAIIEAKRREEEQSRRKHLTQEEIGRRSRNSLTPSDTNESITQHSQAPGKRDKSSVEKLEAQMPDGDALLRDLIDGGENDIYSDCFDTPSPQGKWRGSSDKSESDSSFDFDSDINDLLALGSGHLQTGNSDFTSMNHVSSCSSSCTNSVANTSASKSQLLREKELNWFDVGTKVGMRLLNSEKVQKLILDSTESEMVSKESGQHSSSEETQTSQHQNIERVVSRSSGEGAREGGSGKTELHSAISSLPSSPVNETPAKPMHALWTSPQALSLRRLSSVAAVTNSDEAATSLGIKGNGPSGTELNGNLNPGESYAAQDISGVHEVICNVKSSEYVLPNAEEKNSARIDVALDKGKSKAAAGNMEDIEVLLVPTVAQQALESSLSLDLTRLKLPHRRPAVFPGVKMVVPIMPLRPNMCRIEKKTKTSRQSSRLNACAYQMATVISSERIYVQNHGGAPLSSSWDGVEDMTNCVSIKVVLDKSFLRDGRFAEMSLRVMDKWQGAKYMPRHSKFPIGSCVSTIFGIGVLVGWRVHDDIHIVRSLWQKRGPGSANAYLNRDALSDIVPAGIGFKVNTTVGKGSIVGYSRNWRGSLREKFIIELMERGHQSSQVVEMEMIDIASCRAAKFMPVVELVREAAKYQIQVEFYELALRQRYLLENDTEQQDGEGIWNGIELVISSFLKAINEDHDFDKGVQKFLSSIIDFLENLEFGSHGKSNQVSQGQEDDSDSGNDAIFAASLALSNANHASSPNSSNKAEAGFWDFFGGMFQSNEEPTDDDTLAIAQTASFISFSSAVPTDHEVLVLRSNKAYKKIYAFLKIIMRTVAIIRVSVSDRPNLHLGLSILHECLVFVRTVIKVQQANMSPESVVAWKMTTKQFKSIFGPMKERIAQLVNKVAKRLERHGRKAKQRLVRFADILLADDLFLHSLELLEGSKCIYRIEHAAIKAKIVDTETCAQYHEAGLFVYNNLAPRAKGKQEAAERNEEKLAYFARFLQLLAAPHRTLLKFLTRDDVLDGFERLLVRVFQRDAEASRILNIQAFNFHSIRHFRMLMDISVFGKVWAPLLDAADEEFSALMAPLPENGKVYIEPFSRLFSLGVAHFHRIRPGGTNGHWLDFLTSEDAVAIIQELDSKFLRSIDTLCKDVKEVMEVLPYYSTIDEDILKLIDEVSIKEFSKELADALVDVDRFPIFMKEKIEMAVSRFLDYLPKMSIPIEKREIGEGWAVTMKMKNGEDLRLSDVQVEQENLTCEVLGGDNILSPVFELKKHKTTTMGPTDSSGSDHCLDEDENDESDEEECISVLTDIADLIRNAQLHGCWEAGLGGVTDRSYCIDPALKGLPVSEMLRSGIELWQNLEIDDDELMQLAIRDVTYQIQLQKDIEDGKVEKRDESNWRDDAMACEDKSEVSMSMQPALSMSKSLEGVAALGRRRFNPREDPTLLYLELSKLTFCLDEFLFRIEPMERLTIFDPVFEGYGNLMVKNVSIQLRLECRKERVHRLTTEVFVPVLQLQTLEVVLEKVKFKFKETGADWLLNNLVKGFRDIISEVVESNVKDQIVHQITESVASLNTFLASNPELLLNVLGIAMDDLEEHVIYM